MSKKTLEELVFHDDFMFAAVMMDAENCRCFLEQIGRASCRERV